MMRYIQASRHLRSLDKILASDEDKLPGSRSSALISQTLLHCNIQKNIKLSKSVMLQVEWPLLSD